MRKETTAMSSRSHHPTGGRRSRLERYSGTPPVAYQDGKDTKEVEGHEGARSRTRRTFLRILRLPSYPSCLYTASFFRCRSRPAAFSRSPFPSSRSPPGPHPVASLIAPLMRGPVPDVSSATVLSAR